MELNEFLEDVQTKKLDEELDVQKAVVESLAADKAEQDEFIKRLRSENVALRSEVEMLRSQVGEMRQALAKVGDVLATNSENLNGSTNVTLLERNPELADRFAGETMDHALEVIREARDAAEKDGRLRRAQVLEGILVANETNGTLTQRRADLEKLFSRNGNILTGPVIEELEKRGLSHKNGEEYLLPSEIIKRAY